MPWYSDLLGQSKHEANEDVEFVLIGAGLPRTGTMSTHAALEVILPGKCTHMKVVCKCRTGRNNNFWPKALEGQVTEEDWKEFVNKEKLSAGIDYPFSYFWRDLSRIFPKAKILLTVRDPVKWYESVKNSIFELDYYITTPPYSTTIWVLSMLAGNRFIADTFKTTTSRVCWAPVGERYPKGMFGAVQDGKQTAVDFFNDWKDEVIKQVPSDRLMVFDVREGWGPLCEFLDMPEPEVPFPNLNDTREQQKIMRDLKTLTYILWSILPASIAIAAYYMIYELMLII